MYIRKFYTDTIKKYIKIMNNDKPVLGRWNTKHKKEQIDRKIYLANYDNCGPCGYINNDKNLK